MKKNNNLLVNKMYLIQKVKSLYNEYKKFINCDLLPDYELHPFNFLINKNNIIENSMSAKVEFKNNTPILSIEENIFKIKPQTAEAILFHEFTHIWDETTYLQNLSYEERKFILHSYTEYHATYIQMMRACNFNNIKDDKKLDENVTVYDDNKPQNIINYIKSLENDYLDTVRNIIFKDFQPIDTLMLIIYGLYLQSKIDFFENYCSFNINQLINTQVAIDLFGDNFNKLIELIRNPCQDNTVEWFEKQNNLRLLSGTDIHKNKNEIRKKLMT